MAISLPIAGDSGEYDDDDVPIGPMTFDEYIAFVETADRDYELVGGMLYPRGVGGKNIGTAAHASISVNLAARLHAVARRAGCRVYSQAFAVRTLREEGYVPDAMVSCGPKLPPDAPALEDPCLIVEVLSPSTRRVDFGEKLRAYQALNSLQTYWIVESTWRCVHRHWRDAEGAWQVDEVSGDDVLPMPFPLASSLTLDEVYEDVDVPRETPRPPLRWVREPDAEYGGEYEEDAEPTHAG